MQLGRELRTLIHVNMFDRKITIKAMCRNIGIHPNAVYRFINGGDVKLSVVEKVLKELDLEVDVTAVSKG